MKARRRGKGVRCDGKAHLSIDVAIILLMMKRLLLRRTSSCGDRDIDIELEKLACWAEVGYQCGVILVSSPVFRESTVLVGILDSLKADVKLKPPHEGR